MECPSCAKPMIEETHHGVMVDRCQSCQGFWFDIEEIQRYLNARGTRSGHPVPKDQDLMNLERGDPRQCTCCEETALREGSLHGIDYLRCSWCGGVFLSGTELAKIQSDSTGIPRKTEPAPTDPVGLGIDIVEFVAALIFGLFTGFE